MVTMTTLHAVCLIACFHLSAGQASSFGETFPYIDNVPSGQGNGGPGPGSGPGLGPGSGPGPCVSVSVDLHTASPYTLQSSVNYPKPYASNVCMQWTLTAPQGRCTVVKVKGGFFTEANYDFVRITEAGGRSKQYNGSNHPIDEILFFTHGSSTSVKFTSDGSVERTGFQLSVELTGCEPALVENTVNGVAVQGSNQNGCPTIRTTLQPASPFLMASTNHPNRYPDNDCQDWVVDAPTGKCTLIKVHGGFDTERVYDQVTITSENNRGRTYDGHNHPTGEVLFFTSGRNTNVHFTTDFSATSTGFLLSAQLVDCKPAIAENTVNGVAIISPGYNNHTSSMNNHASNMNNHASNMNNHASSMNNHTASGTGNPWIPNTGATSA